MSDEPRELADAEGRPALDRIGRRLLIPAVLALVALLALALVADARELARAVAAFDYALLVPVLALSLANYVLRFVRWQLYLDALDVRLSRKDSLGVFLVGFVLSVTPGKAGELGKAWLARALGGGAARRTVAAVLGERVLDVLGMLVLIAIGALAFQSGPWVAAACLSACAAVLLVLSWQRAAHWAIGAAGRLPGLGGRLEILADVYDHLRDLLRARILFLGLLLSTLAWGAEAIGFGIVVRSYAADTGWLVSIFNYSASTLFGALSMLPGGLLASEGALTALLDWQGLETAAAASATLVIRAATLWFAVALGLIALPWTLRRLRAG